jgi:hypothetical protein
MPARGRSAHSDFAIPHTAWATTATATTLSPWIAPTAAGPAIAPTPSAKAISSSADGSVKPTHAASAPSQPARPSPTAMPNWLLAGPGRNWHKATRSA